MQVALDNHLYNRFAALLEYPRDGMKELARECVDALLGHTGYPPEVAEDVAAFKEETARMSIEDLKGLYSYTFEFAADTTLDMGYFLYEGFKRSNALASIKGMYKDKGFPFDVVAQGELPDHLPVVLRFLAFVDDGDIRKSFREDFLVKALEKLSKNFEKLRDNPYRRVIEALLTVIDRDIKAEG